jgi:hypothetical protein
MALQFAAAERRVRCVAAFIPLTNLLVPFEFAGMESAGGSAAQSAFWKVRTLALTNVADELAGRPIWVCIGNNDQRVGTDNAIAFTRRLVEASYLKRKPVAVELHVTATEGHGVYASAHEDAAAWILARMKEVR